MASSNGLMLVPIAAIAAVASVVHVLLLRNLGGRMFEDHPLLALGVALAVTFGATAVRELARRLQR